MCRPAALWEQCLTAACMQVLDLAKAFRLTKQQPGLYWLPLTKEQVVARAAAREQREQQRPEKAS